MNCEEARELFDMAVDGALDPATSRRFEAHLHGCSSCQTGYDAVKAESELLGQALQADLASRAEIARIEARISEATRPTSETIAGLWEWMVPVLGTLLGVLVLVGGRFDGAVVREAICLSLNPRGGLPVAIPSVLVAALVILAVMLIQSLIFRTREQD